MAQLQKPFGPFCQHLKNMPVRLPHDIENALDEIAGNVTMKKIAHGVHENRARLLPVKRQTQRMFVYGRLETVHVVALAHCLQTSRHTLGIAVTATRACLSTAGDGIPGGLGPFDGGVGGHQAFLRPSSCC